MNKNNSLTFALVILSSGIIIAIGVLVYRTDFINKISKEEVVEQKIEEDKIQPISERDHLLGDPNADIVIIEYADFSCPACKEFHNTMRLIIEQFGQNGRVSWVFRQSPLQGEGSDSIRLALTSECVSEIYGKTNFWKFTNEIFDNAPTSLEKENTDLILENLNLDPKSINSCVDSNKTVAEKVNRDLKDREYLVALDSGFGTPYNIIKTSTGDTTTFTGAIPYVLLNEIINQNSLDFN